MPDHDRPRNPGARAVGDGDRRRGGGGLPKWLLPLLLALILIILLIVLLRSCGDDSSSSRKGTSTGTSTGQSKSGSQGAGSAGTLTAGGTALLPAAGKDLKAAAGKRATGQRVRVQSVVPKVGFWVGTSAKDRVFVEYGSRYKGTEPGSKKISVKPGQRVKVTGPVRRTNARIIRQLTSRPADVALLRREGVFINASRVTKA